MKIYKIKVNGKTYRVELESVEEVKSDAVTEKVESKPAPQSTGEGKEVLAPIQGTVVAVKVSVGQKVKKGDVVAVIEAMKLENDVNAPCDGEISEILVTKGTSVAVKQLLLKIK